MEYHRQPSQTELRFAKFKDLRDQHLISALEARYLLDLYEKSELMAERINSRFKPSPLLTGARALQLAEAAEVRGQEILNISCAFRSTPELPLVVFPKLYRLVARGLPIPLNLDQKVPLQFPAEQIPISFHVDDLIGEYLTASPSSDIFDDASDADDLMAWGSGGISRKSTDGLSPSFGRILSANLLDRPVFRLLDSPKWISFKSLIISPSVDIASRLKWTLEAMKEFECKVKASGYYGTSCQSDEAYDFHDNLVHLLKVEVYRVFLGAAMIENNRYRSAVPLSWQFWANKNDSNGNLRENRILYSDKIYDRVRENRLLGRPEYQRQVAVAEVIRQEGSHPDKKAVSSAIAWLDERIRVVDEGRKIIIRAFGGVDPDGPLTARVVRRFIERSQEVLKSLKRNKSWLERFFSS